MKNNLNGRSSCERTKAHLLKDLCDLQAEAELGDSDSDEDESDANKQSKRKKKLESRLKIAELKQVGTRTFLGCCHHLR